MIYYNNVYKNTTYMEFNLFKNMYTIIKLFFDLLYYI